MGRKRIDLGGEASAQIVARMARGDSAEMIAADFGVSPATMKRRMRELRGKSSSAPAAARAPVKKPAAAPRPPAPPTASTPIATDPPPALAAPQASAPIGVESAEDESEDEPIGDFSVGATLAEIDKWLRIAKERAEAAAALENPKVHAEYMRMIIQLLEARRKAAPAPKVDPNDSPDMVENAAKVRKRWHEKADALFRVASSPLAETIGKILRGEIKTT